MQLNKLCLPTEVDAGEDPVLDWRQVFANANPVEVELGIGKGRFVIDAASRNPQINYIGVERAAKYLRLAEGRSARRGLENVRFARVDAQEFVEFFVASESLRAVHLYFPDPWPKKRHHKRRLFKEEFLREVERILEPGGLLWLATDHAEYFETMELLLTGSVALSVVELEWSGAKTNYEEKYVSAGKPIYRRILQKSR